MSNCCETTISELRTHLQCPSCLQTGKAVPLITLKSLLKPTALQTIEAESPYVFCATPSCEVVYFNPSQTFDKENLKVPVFQKDVGMDVPVCYCFDWTRERLIDAVKESLDAIGHIRKQIQANRCGCEVNNPQGACCLGNVNSYIRKLGQN